MWTIWTLWPGANNWAPTDFGEMPKAEAMRTAWRTAKATGRRHRISDQGRPGKGLI